MFKHRGKHNACVTENCKEQNLKSQKLGEWSNKLTRFNEESKKDIEIHYNNT